MRWGAQKSRILIQLSRTISYVITSYSIHYTKLYEAVLSFVKGKSGKLYADDYATSKGSVWEVFDAGIACQTFCLAAHAKGIGTCIFGVIDDKTISEIVNLPEEETVAALIVYGYEEGEHAAPTPRMEVEEIARFV